MGGEIGFGSLSAVVPVPPEEYAMAEADVIKVLQEIRDLQRQHVENYKNALTNQQESIEIQRQAVRRQKVSLLVLLAIVFAAIALVVAGSFLKH